MLGESARADAAEARAKQSADAWVTISSLPNYCSYSRTQMVPVPAGEPTYALLASELQRTARATRGSEARCRRRRRWR